MSRIAIVLVSLVFASSAFLLPTSQAQIVPENTLSGQVCMQPGWYEEYDDGYCYEHLPDASLRLQGDGTAGLGAVDKTTTSDAEGWFEFTSLPDGDYTLTVTRQGFEDHVQEIALNDSQHVSVAMTPDRVDVAGHLVDGDGQGVSGAYIQAYGDNDWGDAKTDETGRFELSLTSGWYQFEIEAPGHSYAGERMMVDGSDLEIVLDVLPGQEARISGRVVDQDGEPVEDADVIIYQWEARTGDGKASYGNYRNWTTTDAQGRYEANLYGGGVSIEFRKENHAGVYEWLELGAKETRTLDVEMLRYPEKTAHIEGRVVGSDGQALPYVRISIELPEFGLHECSMRDGDQTMRPEPMAEPAYDEGYAMSSEPYPYYESCAITIHDDGSFEGTVTPGYGILRAYYDHWASCDETHHADGGYERDCGPDYFANVQVVQLSPDADHVFEITLREKPRADAVISGYVVNGEAMEAIPGAHISFHNQENYAYGGATTDGDGSYKIRLRSGYHEVSVWAEGYLPWSGMVYVDAGGETPFDVLLTPGEARYGGCCYYYDDVAYAEAEMASSDGGGSSAPSQGAAPRPMPAEEASMPSTERSSDEGYEDLGGGLGPYDPEARRQALSEGAPGGAIPNPVAWALIGLALVAVFKRR